MSTADTIFSTENLCAGYGSIPVVHNVSLGIKAGEILGILGHNGMGKTTLLKALIGLLPATHGRIVLGATDLTRTPVHQRVRAGLAYVPQGRDIFASLTVKENLLFGTANVQDIDRVVSDFPIIERLLDRRGGSLSGGEQQILALARALAPNPRVLLLDEPTEGIAPSIVEEIEEHLRRLAATLGLSVIVVEQDLDFIRMTAGRVLMIHRGEIAKEMSASDLNNKDIAESFFGVAIG